MQYNNNNNNNNNDNISNNIIQSFYDKYPQYCDAIQNTDNYHLIYTNEEDNCNITNDNNHTINYFKSLFTNCMEECNSIFQKVILLQFYTTY